MSGWDGRAGVQLGILAPPEKFTSSGGMVDYDNRGNPVENRQPVRERFVGIGAEPVIYANAAQVRKSSHDICVQLGIVLSADERDVTTRVLASVYMSESHARALLDLLTKVLG